MMRRTEERAPSQDIRTEKEEEKDLSSWYASIRNVAPRNSDLSFGDAFAGARVLNWVKEGGEEGEEDEEQQQWKRDWRTV